MKDSDTLLVVDEHLSSIQSFGSNEKSSSLAVEPLNATQASREKKRPNATKDSLYKDNSSQSKGAFFGNSELSLPQSTHEAHLQLPSPIKDCVIAHLQLKPGVDVSEAVAELEDLIQNAMDEKGVQKWKDFLDKLGEGEHRDRLEEWYKYRK